jgi:hypothetical protein
MSAKHTPGPWRVDYKDMHGQQVVMNDHIEIATCWHHCVGSIEKEMDANVRLIAAAPELLEALQAIIGLPAHPMRKKAVEIARAAVAKATGESA